MKTIVKALALALFVSASFSLPADALTVKQAYSLGLKKAKIDVVRRRVMRQAFNGGGGMITRVPGLSRKDTELVNQIQKSSSLRKAFDKGYKAYMNSDDGQLATF